MPTTPDFRGSTWCWRRSGDTWTVQDLNSKNGTFVNGTRIEAARPLGPSDRITAGHLTLEFAEKLVAPPANTVIFVEAECAQHRGFHHRRHQPGRIAERREGDRGRRGDAGADSRRTGAGGQHAAGRSVQSDHGSFHRRGGRVARRADDGGGRRSGGARGARRRISNQRHGARSRDQGENLAAGARCPPGRGLRRAHEHRAAADSQHAGGAAADRRSRDRIDLPGFAALRARVHQGRSQSADRDGERRGDPHRAHAPG